MQKQTLITPVIFILILFASSGVYAHHMGAEVVNGQGFVIHSINDGEITGEGYLTLESDLNIQEKNIINASTITADTFVGDGSGLSGVAGVPTGTILFYAVNSSTPQGWLDTDGSIISRTSYTNLCDLINDTYGMANATHCQLPNMTG